MMKESLPRIYSSDEELFTPIDHETPDLLEDHRLEPYRGQKHVGGPAKTEGTAKSAPPPISPPSREDADLDVAEKAWDDSPGVIPARLESPKPELVILDRIITSIREHQHGRQERTQWFF